jgi:CDP-glycerol glycerophosphotransferase
MRAKIEFLIKHNAFIQFFYRFIFSFIFRFIGLFVKINPNMILFSSFMFIFNMLY